MQVIHELRIPYQKDPDLKALVSEHLGVPQGQIAQIRTLKRSLDARNQKRLYWVYGLEVYLEGENLEIPFQAFPKLNWTGPPPLILGAGPAGMFAAWTFLQHGIHPILFERGERTHPRMQKISKFWRKGELDADSNVCNGEGGAGTFSDGKLITRIKSPWITRVMHALVGYGAPEEIAYVYNPHVGSNRIRDVIKTMSETLVQQGAKLLFNTCVGSLDFENGEVQGVLLSDGQKISGTGLILACGHSAGPLFERLYDQGVQFQAKSFALGLRIEHSQEWINRWQYGPHAEINDLEAAQYKMATYWDEERIGVYSFCMCPGGYVISSTTDPETTVVNGMSNYHRNSPWANAAIVCTVPQENFPGDDPFKMMRFQREVERGFFRESAARGESRKIPAQRLEDFLAGRAGKVKTKSSCPSGIVDVNLGELLPEWIRRHLHEGMLDYDRRRRGFALPDAVLHGVESRTSSPVRITRDSQSFESVSTPGLFPCGEGPGYAGGITSAAVDGIEAALAWIRKYIPKG